VFAVVSEALSVTRAAERLNITQSSVSYHVRKLETELGVVLFRRTPSGLRLTEEGEVLVRHVARGLGAIARGLEQVARRAGSVRVAVLPMFASRWLSSRLGTLLEAHPDLQLSIQNHNNSYARMAAPEGFADLGIQWGRGRWDAFDVTRLWPETLVVVASPDYLAAHPIATPQDLASCTLLHVDDTRMWEEWFAGNGMRIPPGQPQMMLEDRHFQLSSTINGLGVSLFAAWLLREELARGVLVDPFGRVFDTSFAYHLILPADAEPTAPVERFRDWLVSVSGDGP
jgi:LysR family glycine cleavage system transcriptional activator